MTITIEKRVYLRLFARRGYSHSSFSLCLEVLLLEGVSKSNLLER